MTGDGEAPPGRYGCFGTPEQQRLQMRAIELAPWVRETPGACLTGRVSASEDPDLLGWETVFRLMEEEGLFGFRFVTPDGRQRIEAKMAERGCTCDWWDSFVADPDGAGAAIREILATPLPEGLREAPQPDGAEDPVVAAAQDCMASCGIAPLPGFFLAGVEGPSALVALFDAAGRVAATAFVFFPQNRHSPRARWAWAGLVAVREDWRGRGLGTWVNARVLAHAFDRLGAERVTEMATSTNAASRAMLLRCGLVHEPGLQSGVARPAGGASFTR